MSKTVWTARTDSDFVKIGKRSKNLKSERQVGSHWIGETDEGRVTVTNHNRELKPWLRLKIAREFSAVGLALFIIAFGLWYFVA